MEFEMSVQLQHFDTNYSRILGSPKTLACNGIGVQAVERVGFVADKNREKRVSNTPNETDKKRLGRVQRGEIVIRKHASKEQSLGRNGDSKFGKKKIDTGGVLKYNFRDGHTLMGTVRTTRLKKGFSYGGRLPAILEALEMFNDLDEAFEPWADTLNNKERSIILKEQVRWERALEIFEWFKTKGCYELNVIHYNIMLRILGKAQEWSRVEGLWNEMNVKGIEAVNSTYGTLIDVYSKSGLKEEALVWLEIMRKQGIEPDEVTMGIVVQLYKKAGEFRKAEDFFKRWSLGESLREEIHERDSLPETEKKAVHSPGSLSSHTYNALIDVYGKAGQLQEASETFGQMLEEGKAPTTVTFNTMIHICGNQGQLDEATALLQKMEKLGCTPDTRTYNILISQSTKHDDIEMAARYFRKMKDDGLFPDLVSYRILLYAYSIRCMVQDAEDLLSEMDEWGLEIDEYTQSALLRMYIQARMLEQSWLWFSRFHLAGNMSSECYSANIDAYGEHGYISEAEKVFTCCQEKKKLTVLVFNVMLKAYGIGKCYEKACLLFDSMENHGTVGDRCSYVSLIQILASADQPFIAIPYLRKMQELGLVTDCFPYCTLISSFAKLGHLEMAKGQYKEMIKNGVDPDAIVYGVLINAFADAGNVQEAISCVNEMKKAGLHGNTVIYTTLIKLYTKVGLVKEAQEIYSLLQASDEGPSLYSSNSMINLYSRQLMVKDAEEIFEMVKGKGVANEFTFAMMLCMYKRLGRLGEASRIAEQMRKLGLLTDLLSYNNVLDLHATSGRPRETLETFKKMIEASIEPDDFTFKSLGILLLKCGFSKQGVGKLEVIRKKDLSNGVRAWVSALSSVIEMNEVDDY